MPKDRKVVEAGLLKKGFRQREGDHHFFIYWSLSGKKSVAFTKTSHSHRVSVNRHLACYARIFY